MAMHYEITKQLSLIWAIFKKTGKTEKKTKNPERHKERLPVSRLEQGKYTM